MKHIILFFFILFPLAISAQTEISITSGQFRKSPILIEDFSYSGANLRDISQSIPNVIRTNLGRSGAFEVRNSRVGKTGLTLQQVRDAGAVLVLSGAISQEGNDRARVSIVLTNAASEQQILVRNFATSISNWRRVAHLISDAAYERTTGEGGYFDTRILYIAEEIQGNRILKRIAIMDQDGANHMFLTKGQVQMLGPRFSDDMKNIIYMTFAGYKPEVHMRNLETGRTVRIAAGSKSGMTFSPRFSPDGSKAIMSSSIDGSTQIITVDLRSMKTTNLSKQSGISTSPMYSPDMRTIAFESDRGGSQQLYLMNVDGSGVRRISFGGGKYANPVWSPKGDKIAFIKIQGGSFSVGVMNPDGSNERILSSAFLIENPAFAPNGTRIVYSRKDRGARGPYLYSVDLLSGEEIRVPTPSFASDPSWSKLLN